MNVAFVTSIFPNPAMPTLGTFHGQLAAELRRVCNLTVISPHPWFPRLPQMAALERWQQFGRIPARFATAGVEAFSPKYPMVPGVSERVRPRLMAPSLTRLAARLHRARPFDVINGLWMYPDGVAAAAMARRLGVPFVLTGLGCDINDCMDEPALRSQIVRSACDARAVIVVSDALKDRLCAEGVPADQVVVITNGVNTESFRIRDRAASARALGLPDGVRRLLYVGRLAEEKAPLSLIEAMAALRRVRSDARLYMVGDGPEREAAAQRIAALGLQDDVVLLGARNHDQVAEWIGAGEVLCLPSLREGCPNVVLEALASGRPVVGTNVGGVPDLIDGRNGLLVPPLNPDAMAVAMDAALARSWDPIEVRRSVEDRSWRRTAAAYYDVFRAAAQATLPAPSRASAGKDARAETGTIPTVVYTAK
jgi:teichuronic acid biosynthesis glycosyltransferase TuaC